LVPGIAFTGRVIGVVSVFSGISAMDGAILCYETLVLSFESLGFQVVQRR
jgi:hypothetical protein